MNYLTLEELQHRIELNLRLRYGLCYLTHFRREGDKVAIVHTTSTPIRFATVGVYNPAAEAREEWFQVFIGIEGKHSQTFADMFLLAARALRVPVITTPL